MELLGPIESELDRFDHRHFPDAFRKLGPRDFGLWVRLLFMSNAVRKQGIAAMAEDLGLPKRTLARRLRRLHEHGFVYIDHRKNGRPAWVIVVVRPTGGHVLRMTDERWL